MQHTESRTAQTIRQHNVRDYIMIYMLACVCFILWQPYVYVLHSWLEYQWQCISLWSGRPPEDNTDRTFPAWHGSSTTGRGCGRLLPAMFNILRWWEWLEGVCPDRVGVWKPLEPKKHILPGRHTFTPRHHCGFHRYLRRLRHLGLMWWSSPQLLESIKTSRSLDWKVKLNIPMSEFKISYLHRQFVLSFTVLVLTAGWLLFFNISSMNPSQTDIILVIYSGIPN